MFEDGFYGFPRASRSVRARGLNGNKFDRSFEILASVAGKLLDKNADTDDDASCVKDLCCACDCNASRKKGNGDQAHEASYAEINSSPRMVDSDEKLETVGGRIAFGAIEGVSEKKVANELNRNEIIKDEVDIVAASSGDSKTLEVKLPELDSVFGTGNKRIDKDSETNHCTKDRKIEETCDDKKIFPFKKRKFFNHDPLCTSDQGFDRKHVSPENRINRKACAARQQSSPNSKECNVKLSIKYFKVPELFIDISMNATVGSLKRTVMEAVSSVLGDGLHVGILVQGKKVRDDNKTLIQTGISLDDKSHNLGFVLEPKHSRTTKSTSFKNEALLSHGLIRHCVHGTSKASREPRLKNPGSHVESDLSAGEVLAYTSSNETNPDSKPLVPVPKISMKALAVVPLRRKSGHNEYGQRRIRRPFSVTEVEALVRAVEKLGTGRWRDIKFHAFDNSKHRTYVDLKDKWKTLVHTARISPQQRRGEPVPQELLNRVLATQAFWSHRQAKQHAMITI